MTVNNRLEEEGNSPEFRARDKSSEVEIFRPVITIIQLEVIWAPGWHACSTCALCQRLAPILMHPVFNRGRPYETSDRRLMFKTVVPWKKSRIVEREAATRSPIVVVAGQIAVVAAAQTLPYFHDFSLLPCSVGVTTTVYCVSGLSKCEICIFSLSFSYIVSFS